MSLTSLSTVGKDVGITGNDNLCEDEVDTLTAQLTSFSRACDLAHLVVIIR